MIQIIKDAKAMVQTLEAQRTELKAQGEDLIDVVILGTSRVYIDGISDNQKIYAMSMMNSRLEGVKLFREIELVKQCKKAIEDFKAAMAHISKLKSLKKEIYEYNQIRYDAEGLLTIEEKRTILKDKVESTKKGKLPLTKL
jgi:hypothetical protein